MAPTKKQKPTQSSPQPDLGIPGGITLSLVAFENGERGFMAKGRNNSALEFFDLEIEPIQTAPGSMTILRTLGEYAPGDEAGFWELITRV
jgi:hypothetical protein